MIKVAWDEISFIGIKLVYIVFKTFGSSEMKLPLRLPYVTLGFDCGLEW